MHARSRLLSILAFVIPTVASSQPGGPLVFHGTPVAPRGAATLTISASGNLIVGNIGPGEIDGFDLLTGRAEGVKVKFPWLPSEPGREVHFEVQTDVGIEPCLVVTRAPSGGVDIFVDFSSTGADGLLIDVYDAGVPVAQTFVPVGEMLHCDEDPVAMEVEMGAIPAIGISPLVSGYVKLPAFRIPLAQEGTIYGGAGPIAMGDEIRVYPSNPLSLPDEMVGLGVVFDEATPAGPFTFELDDAAQLLEGRLHRGTMFGLISKDFDAPVTFDFSVPAGLSGGIEMEMKKGSDTQQTITQNIKFASAGDTDAFYVTGEGDDGLEVELARVSGACDGGSWVLTADFSGSGSPGASVQLFDETGMPLIPPDPILGGIVVGSNAFPIQVGVDSRDGLSIAYDYMDPVPVTIPQGTFPASRILMFGTGDVPALLTQTGRLFSCVSDFTIEITGEPNTVRTGDNGFYLSSVAGQFGKSVVACPCVETVDDGTSGGGPFTFEPVVQQDQFGVEWVAASPPSPVQPETDWDFVSRLAADASPLARMGIHIQSGPGGVELYARARSTPKTDFGTIVKNGMSATAEFVHSSELVPFAVLPQWPAAIGYQVLHHDDKTWSMWINLGQTMDVVIPGDPPARGATAASQVVSADFIHLVFLDTPIASPVAESKLVMRGYEKSHRLFYGSKEKAVAVGPAPSSARLAVRPPYPNPFNPSTTLAFDLPTAGDVSVRVYTVRGEYVATLHSGWMGAGPHTVGWDGVNHKGERTASGVYLVELRAPGGTRHAKMNLLK